MWSSQYPYSRLRRNRKAQWSRDITAESTLSVKDFIYPLFIHDKEEDLDISTMPGVKRLSLRSLVEVAKQSRDAGIPAIMLFPAVDSSLKSLGAEEAYNPDSCICKAIQMVKAAVPEIGVMADVALDPYTTHGHDGITDDEGYVSNDATVEVLVKQALTLAKAGCDVVAPSDMMDGRTGQIRKALEAEGFVNTQILTYAAKYVSNLYAPFRDAVGSKNNLKKADKKTYQMNFANSKEALMAVSQAVNEGADMVIVKPGTPYLDIIKTVSDHCPLPVIPYQVSGEYAVMKLAAANGILAAFEPVMFELLLGMKRAGASAILTYAALEMAHYLAEV
ncbi:MAG: porphobilinogen synthase [Proteobacteria bacterium]|nr:porphobilinogen synthase [Pseudomonadota bacterium]